MTSILPSETFRPGADLSLSAFADSLAASGFADLYKELGDAGILRVVQASMPARPNESDPALGLLALVGQLGSLGINLDRYLAVLADRVATGVERLGEAVRLMNDEVAWPLWPDLPLKHLTNPGEYAVLLAPSQTGGTVTIRQADGSTSTYESIDDVLLDGWIPD
jgi:hypothetical protein